MSVDDRVGLATHVVSQDDKLSRTFSVPVHASVQSVSQVWRAGPLRVRLEEGKGANWLVLELPWMDLLRFAVGVGFEYARVVDWCEVTRVLRVELRFNEVLDRCLVELVDVIADVRRASGTVQLELEGLEGSGG